MGVVDTYLRISRKLQDLFCETAALRKLRNEVYIRLHSKLL